MGLVATGLSLLRSAGTFLGIGGGAVARAGGALGTVSRVAIGPFGQALAGGALGAGAISAFGGGGGVPGMGGGQLAQLVAAGAQPVPLSNGRFMVTAPNGDLQIFNRSGMPIRPRLIIPAGQRLPGGAIVVSTRQNGALIGIITQRRRRRFGAEIRTVRRTVQAAQSLVKLCQPQKRRSSHG